MSNLPAKASKIADIRTLLERSKKQMEMALPKHLTADRLLRVAMTSIQKTPKLMDCTPQSLLACVMTCAQLGLEPDQFLGQAYLVPFKDNKSGTTICTLIPGYRGYIALARRSGEMQTVSAQVVYERDEFSLAYGINDTLEHRPNLSGDRGKPIGAYCVFKYKDGAYSFDFLPVADIEKIRTRSKAANDGPWVSDWDEMAKKTVIKRHSKLAPLSVEFQRAVALEDRAMAGEPQADLLTYDDNVIDADPAVPTGPTFENTVPKGALKKDVAAYLDALAAHEKTTVEAVKAEAVKDPEKFWMIFQAWVKQQKAHENNKGEPETDQVPAGPYAPGECPDRPGTTTLVAFCDKCGSREGCPVWR